MVVEGFFIKVDDIPPAWRWMHWIAFHSSSFANFMHIEFDGRTIGADLSAVPPAAKDFDGSDVLKSFEFEDQDVWFNIGIMVLLLRPCHPCCLLCIHHSATTVSSDRIMISCMYQSGGDADHLPLDRRYLEPLRPPWQKVTACTSEHLGSAILDEKSMRPGQRAKCVDMS